jgi:quercetin dioxygenase-like cupin family protein
MRPQHLLENGSFSDKRFFPQLVYGSSRVRAFLLCLEPGQGLPPRDDSEEMLCCMIEGRAKLTVGEETFTVSAGDLAAAAPGQVRAIEAASRVTALWIHIGAQSESDAEGKA